MRPPLANDRLSILEDGNVRLEFLSVGALIVLSIFLRQRGSPESKPVAGANRENE